MVASTRVRALRRAPVSATQRRALRSKRVRCRACASWMRAVPCRAMPCHVASCCVPPRAVSSRRFATAKANSFADAPASRAFQFHRTGIGSVRPRRARDARPSRRKACRRRNGARVAFAAFPPCGFESRSARRTRTVQSARTWPDARRTTATCDAPKRVACARNEGERSRAAPYREFSRMSFIAHRPCAHRPCARGRHASPRLRRGGRSAHSRR